MKISAIYDEVSTVFLNIFLKTLLYKDQKIFIISNSTSFNQIWNYLTCYAVWAVRVEYLSHTSLVINSDNFFSLAKAGGTCDWLNLVMARHFNLLEARLEYLLLSCNITESWLNEVIGVRIWNWINGYIGCPETLADTNGTVQSWKRHHQMPYTKTLPKGFRAF